jgi:large subunit ribosomal protein L24
MKIKKNDTIKVITGTDKGKVGKVLEVDLKNGRIRVEGVRLVTKHQKPRSQGQKGTKIQTEGWINVSNVMFYDSESAKTTRISAKFVGDKKVRFSNKLDKEI